MPRRTDFSRVERIGAAFEGVETGTSYGAPALKVNGRMFACVPTHRTADPGSLAVRMSLVERDLRLRSQPEVYYLEPHYEPHPVVLARLAGLSDEDLKELLEVGWRFERGKKKPRR
ncbi:MAG: MmcQ/YjbR family DNA-binding protein [Gemmatimonadota bacterium]|nr:MmcQ/YjbR family DNA-binding protein [Gemmatimonadota bacterium]MDE3215597.1 MmcQ/YjbR family DNA-binding protein [Gemmatimonadota bacterium]